MCPPPFLLFLPLRELIFYKPLPLSEALKGRTKKEKKMQTILLIDDDERLASLLCEFFSRYDLALISETNPLKGIKTIQNNDNIALIILDIMLPDIDGFEACRRIRKNSDIPILMLTARGDVMDRIIGLEIGADDYLAKPFEPRELVARIHNILKRFYPPSQHTQDDVLQWHDLILDKRSHQASLKGDDLNLTSKEFELFLLLAENPDKVFNRDEIMNELSGIDVDLFSRSIDILVSRLRQKLKPLDCVQTLRGRGYRFISPTL